MGEWITMLLKRIKRARKNRAHFWIGVVFSSPGSTTEDPIFELKVGPRFFRVYNFGGSHSAYQGFSQENKMWIWQTSKHKGHVYYWTPLLPKVINEEYVKKTKLKDIR